MLPHRSSPSLATLTRALPLGLLATLACDTADSPVQPRHPAGDAMAGAVAFEASCAICHTAPDGFDLARFAFTDTTILRRATAHVDTATAIDIIAHIRGMGVAPVDRDVRIFQAGGTPAVDDETLAFRLFGTDAWPPQWGETELLAIDPATVPVAVHFPVWSDEESNLDWMPDTPLPAELRSARGGAPQRALDRYRAEPSDENLSQALGILRAVTHDRNVDTAPCARDDGGRLADAAVCFQASRWIAALAGQHLLRYGLSYEGELDGRTRPQDAFWDVGQAARRSLVANRTPVEHAEENWVSWMMLGWVFAPQNHASGYTAAGLRRAGLPRHATFVALRSQAARAPDSPQAYRDLRIAVLHAPSHWLEAAAGTGIRVLEAREARGEGPTREVTIEEARQSLQQAAEMLRRRLGVVDAAPLVARMEALRGAGA